MSKLQSTLDQLAGLGQVFDRFTKDGEGGRVGWNQRKPRNYDNKSGLPWSSVRGRYWRPWKKDEAGND